jgi:hypothetical protein
MEAACSRERPFLPLKPLFHGDCHCRGQSLAVAPRKLPGQLLGLLILDAQGDMNLPFYHRFLPFCHRGF